MKARVDQRLDILWVAILSLLMVTACVVKKPVRTDQARPDASRPAEATVRQAVPPPPPPRVQAMYFAADAEPLDGTHCGSWGRWNICFGTPAPVAQPERCASESMFERCERSVITPLICKNATEGEINCQIIRTSYSNVIGQRQEQCDVVKDRSTPLFNIRCPSHMQLAPAEPPALAAQEPSPQSQQPVALVENRSVPVPESDSRQAAPTQPAPARPTGD